MATMSDYSDYDFHAELNALSLAHDQMREIAGRLLGAISSTPVDHRAVDELLDEFAADLAVHTRREEIGLFAALHRVAVGDDYIGRFTHDHGDIEEALAAARADHSAVHELVHRLEAHLFVEENDMFHAAHQLLAPSDWDDIDRDVAALQLP
jgi:hypothetical protein